MTPNIPTDNMYKFLAVSGVVLMIASVSLYTVQFGTYAQKMGDIYKELVSLEKDLKFSNFQLEKLTPEEIKNDEKLNEVYKETLAFQSKRDILSNIEETAKSQFMYSFTALIIAFVLGLTTAAGGFFFWYHRLQKYEDSIVRNRSTKKSA